MVDVTAVARWKSLIRDVPDFPQPGILFRDITPLLHDPNALREVNAGLAECRGVRVLHRTDGARRARAAGWASGDGADRVLRRVRSTAAQGRTILLTTHDMAEAESVCNRVALIDHGRVIAHETPRTLSQLIAQSERVKFEGGSEETVTVRNLPAVTGVEMLSGGGRRAAGGGRRVEMSDGEAIDPVLQTRVESKVTSLRASRPSLEDV